MNTGLAIAKHFAQKGFDVALSSRNASDAEEVSRQLESDHGVRSKGYALDIANVSDIEKTFSLIKKDFGRLDVFVANGAHQGLNCDALTAKPEVFDAVMNVNARGTFFCCQQAARMMLGKGGAIVIIGSIQYKGAIRNRSFYAMSKGALASLTRCLAYELAEHKIRVNCLVAGAIHTARWDTQTDAQVEKRRSRYPLGVEASGEDIANGVYYLGTDLSANVTGTDLLIDAGLSTCILPYSKETQS